MKKAAPAKKRCAGKPVASIRLPPGEVLTDFAKGKWTVGEPIGRGGFGEIYLAAHHDGKPVPANAGHVIKIEPHGNGPLFAEINFYLRAAKKEIIESFKTAHKLSYLGMPTYIAHGAHDFQGKPYRFMVMERFGDDLDKVAAPTSGKFSRKTVCCLAIKLLDVLEYLHSQGYVHADLKGSNLLVGYQKGKEGQVTLVDFGLAAPYNISGAHRAYKEDPRKAHDGTIEFTSRDAHRGVAPARRGDIEILGLVLLRWLCGHLPWEDKLENKAYVAREKIRYMDKPASLLKECFRSDPIPEEITKLFTAINKIGYGDKPDYGSMRGFFDATMKSRGWKDDGQFEWNTRGWKDDGQFKWNTKGKKRAREEVDGDVAASPKKARGHPKAELTPGSPEAPATVRKAQSPQVARAAKPKEAAAKATKIRASPAKKGPSPKRPTVPKKTALPAKKVTARKAGAATPVRPAKGKKNYSPASKKIPSPSDIRGPPISKSPKKPPVAVRSRKR